MEKITESELSVVVSAIDQWCPGSVQAVEFMVQYMNWREAGVSHDDAMKALNDFMKPAKRMTGKYAQTVNWKRNIETRKG